MPVEQAIPKLETPEQFGVRLGIPAKGVNRLAREGKLGAGLYKVGRYHRIDPIVALAALRERDEGA